GDHIDHAPNELSAAGVEDQFGDTVGRRHSRFEIRATLETMRRVGMNAMTLGHAPDGDRIPPRRFDEDVPCLVRDHRVVSTHHSSEPDWLLRVGYNEIFGRELAVDAVECLQSLAGPGPADNQ